MEERQTLTVRITNIPQTAIAKELFTFLESTLGKGTIFACEIFTEYNNWKSRGHGRVQFDTQEAKNNALSLSQQRKLFFRGAHLVLSLSFDDVISRPLDPRNRVEDGNGVTLFAGVMIRGDCLGILEFWDCVKLWVVPERKRLELFLSHKEECYKLEVQFGDVLETCGCCLDGNKQKVDAILLKLKYAPKVYKKVSGPDVASKFRTDRYHICKEDFDFLWVRTTDFSSMKSIGYLSSLCWKIEQGSSNVDIYNSLPYYKKDVMELSLIEGKKFHSASNLVPLVINHSDFKLGYEVLSGIDIDTAVLVLQKMHKLESTCFEPVSFIKSHLHVVNKDVKNLASAAYNRLINQNVMTCHRVLVTPSKIYCSGPELETSNYIVKNFASYASDFVRVTFVDEDWGRISVGALSTSINRGIFARPHRTDIYDRILSVLRDGIVIGDKRFEFLAFSASQLRSNSVWMFASNEHVKAQDIREWMGCFSKIRSVSKCAARMGQLFSSSMQTIKVQPQNVKVIPDIEVISDGVGYCFSDGIGKISFAFAREVSRKLGLSHIPSAFQIRYGGYKGVIVVDRHSYDKLALRSSMLKFESKNWMLNVTKWSESMPCYLNREIIILLSTLGIQDDIFLALLEEQLQLLRQMLTNREAALKVLESMGGIDGKGVLARMLRQGYEPNREPYLVTMLQSLYENQLSDLRSRSRIFVPKGRVLVGCLDETGILEYGEVYVRITMNKSELHSGEQTFFHKVDDTTSILKGKVVVTKNPCLHPGDVRVLEAVYDEKLDGMGLVDCLVFPQKGERPHPNECSGGDLDGDQYFISWDENLIPARTVEPMDYTGRRPRIMDHDVTLEEIHKFFVDYMVGDTLGAISTAHLVHADRELDKALSSKCLELAALQSMAVDFAKSGAPAEMPRSLKPREFPDFMERWEKPMYVSQGALGKVYRAIIASHHLIKTNSNCSSVILHDTFDQDLIVDGYEAFLETAENHKEQYLDRMTTLLNFYEAKSEVEILTGNLRNKLMYLKHDNRRFGEVKDRILGSAKSLQKEAKGWFEGSCNETDQQKLASAWYYVTYHPTYSHGSANCLGFPWVVGNILLEIKSIKSKKLDENL
ncbi:unnamed protein product [Fraxinus pennsylvanica]|uniref:RNA-dependent RNA polymerase n=1 Tax=Fraxinus pennsylvanica TaxID=56036 RepID=A0AAD1YXD0_9LAMI|nr:unnamed protein product [Fraxinus pennsylvanica]